jgi:hypothetical protein
MIYLIRVLDHSLRSQLDRDEEFLHGVHDDEFFNVMEKGLKYEAELYFHTSKPLLNLLFDLKVVHNNSVPGFMFHDFLLSLADIETLVIWTKSPGAEDVFFTILTSRYSIMVPLSTWEPYISTKFATHTIRIPKDITRKCIHAPRLLIDPVAQLVMNKVGFEIPKEKKKVWTVWI